MAHSLPIFRRKVTWVAYIAGALRAVRGRALDSPLARTPGTLPRSTGKVFMDPEALVPIFRNCVAVVVETLPHCVPIFFWTRGAAAALSNQPSLCPFPSSRDGWVVLAVRGKRRQSYHHPHNSIRHRPTQSRGFAGCIPCVLSPLPGHTGPACPHLLPHRACLGPRYRPRHTSRAFRPRNPFRIAALLFVRHDWRTRKCLPSPSPCRLYAPCPHTRGGVVVVQPVVLVLPRNSLFLDSSGIWRGPAPCHGGGLRGMSAKAAKAAKADGEDGRADGHHAHPRRDPLRRRGPRRLYLRR